MPKVPSEQPELGDQVLNCLTPTGPSGPHLAATHGLNFRKSACIVGQRTGNGGLLFPYFARFKLHLHCTRTS